MISSTFIDRPRLAIVISIVITLGGLLALTRIPIAQLPDIAEFRAVNEDMNMKQTFGGRTGSATRADNGPQTFR